MLKEEQAAELLRRCEAIAGRELKQVRGNLSHAKTRAAAVWELLVVEAAARIGPVEYEPPGGGPDVRLRLPTGRWLAIEVAYLHARFDKEEHLSRMVALWMHEAAKALGPNPPEIECQFHGDDENPAGPRRTLPRGEHERKQFFENPQVAQFLRAVGERPFETHRIKLSDYTVTLTASPREAKSFGYLRWGGSSIESPRVVSEHAAFRAIQRKINQHKIDGPHVVCIGSDVSPVFTAGIGGGLGIRIEQALAQAVRRSRELSGVLAVHIKDRVIPLNGLSRAAHSTIYPIAECRHPLTLEEWGFVQKIELNYWKYTFPLPRLETPPPHRNPKNSGQFGHSHTTRGTMRIKLPAPLLVDVLAGKKGLLDDYGGSKDWFGKSVVENLQAGWSIVACELQDGNVERGEAATVHIDLAPPHDPVFWPSRTKNPKAPK